MQSLVVDLGDGLVEGLALGLRDLELKISRLTGAVGALFTNQSASSLGRPLLAIRVNLQQKYQHPRGYHRGPR